MNFKIVANGFWNIYTSYVSDMNTLQHIHGAKGIQIQINERGNTDMDYQHINRKKYLQNLKMIESLESLHWNMRDKD